MRYNFQARLVICYYFSLIGNILNFATLIKFEKFNKNYLIGINDLNLTG